MLCCESIYIFNVYNIVLLRCGVMVPVLSSLGVLSVIIDFSMLSSLFFISASIMLCCIYVFNVCNTGGLL